jgi:hypothetical protein
MNTNKNFFFAAAIFFAVIISSGIFVFVFRETNTHIKAAQENLPETERTGLIFSHESGFYDASFELTLSAPSGARIFYTLDGSTPTRGSTRYSRPISVRAQKETRVFNIRAVAEGENAEIVTRNFVTGTDVFDRFCENTLVFALSSDPHGLFDHNDGIFVAGIDRETWRKEFSEEHGRLPEISYNHEETPAAPANFNRRGRESERAVHVEMFDRTGALLISQNAGMRVKGGYSRAVEEQKSIELYARDGQNNFRFAFFSNEFSRDGQLIDRYRRIRLRNGGTDRLAGFIRDELSQELFRMAGHSTTQTHVPAAVFLNGDYYGVAWLKSPRTENHLQRLFGGAAANFEIADGGDKRFSESHWLGEERAVSDLREISALAMAGFVGENGDENFAEFSRRICVDELIRYYAMQIYINNYDWPNHNIELWRYFPSEEEQNDASLHEFLRDGKWRVFSHDIEATWAIWDDDSRMVNEDTLRDILRGENHNRWNSSESSAFLYAFVEREETRAQLANVFLDLTEHAFAPENVISALDNLISKIENEHTYALRANVIAPENEWWPSVESVAHSREMIRNFAKLRPEAILRSVSENLGFDAEKTFSVELSVPENGGAMINSLPVGAAQTVAARYFRGTEIKISACCESDSWIVNGETKDESIIFVSDDASVSLICAR